LNFVKYLYPFGSIYGWGLQLRNRFYNNGLFQSSRSPIYSICIGNLAIGGTGKTPLTEYLINMFSDKGIVVAVLSRGYKRKTKGYLQATTDSKSDDIGDEAFQIHKKFPDVKVFVCEDRVKGANRLYGENPEIQLILLDDALQHRAIKANKNLLVTRYDNLYVDDYYIPAGTLRDHKIRANNADIVIVSNCPTNLDVSEKNRLTGKLKLLNHQKLFFSGIIYKEARNLFPVENDEIIESCIVVTGIARPEKFIAHVKDKYTIIKHFNYPDHQDFTSENIRSWINKIGDSPSIAIISTEKDAARLMAFETELKGIVIKIIPIRNHFYGDEKKFENLCMGWVTK
jgi:tetraacyldisaccharide 4'-kinase